MRAALFLCVAITAPITQALGAEPPSASKPDALAIMRKMAANTEAATEARRQYIYHQRVRSGLLKTNGEVVCREAREYDVIPQPNTTEKKLVFFSGACLEGKRMVPYSKPDVERPGLRSKGTDHDADAANGERESIAGLINDLANDSKSRDGIPRQLFPLGPEEIAHYKFTLKGETTINGRRAYDVTFEPAGARGVCIDVGDEQSETKLHVDLRDDEEQAGCRPWKGDVWVDAEDFQPVRITTKLAKGIPWAVRVLMGINIHQLGFSLAYQRVAPGVWFPATYGTEFRFVVFWGFKRTVTLSMENTDFRKTDAQSSVTFGPPEP